MKGRAQDFMRFMIASDIHGSAFWCEKLLKAFDESGAERLILLGDLLYHGPRNALPEGYDPKAVAQMLNARSGRLICVRGNCDSEVDQMMLDFPILSDSAVICAFGQTAFATHGHKFSPETLPPLCAGDIMLYGHTHIPNDETVACGEKKIRCINPGSVSIPKNGSKHGCLIWEDKIFTAKILG